MISTAGHNKLATLIQSEQIVGDATAKFYQRLIDKIVKKEWDQYSTHSKSKLLQQTPAELTSNYTLLKSIKSWNQYLRSEKRFSEHTIKAYLYDLALFLACIRSAYENKSWHGPPLKKYASLIDDNSASAMDKFCEVISLHILSKLDRNDIGMYKRYLVTAEQTRQENDLTSKSISGKQGYARTSIIRSNSALRSFFKHLQKEQENTSDNLTLSSDQLEAQLKKAPTKDPNWEKLCETRDSLSKHLKLSDELLYGFKQFSLGRTKAYKRLPRPISLEKWMELIKCAENMRTSRNLDVLEHVNYDSMLTPEQENVVKTLSGGPPLTANKLAECAGVSLNIVNRLKNNGVLCTESPNILTAGDRYRNLNNLTPKQQTVVKTLLDGPPVTANELAERAGVSVQIVNQLKYKDILKKNSTRSWLNKRNVALLTLLYGCGLRISEALNLKWVDIDKKTILYIKGKGDKPRMVPIVDKVSITMKEYKDAYQEHIKTKLNQSQPVFFGVRGGVLSARSVQYLVAKLRNEIDEPPSFTPHALRHSFATHIYSSSKDLRAIKDLLGHISLDTTIQYTALDDEEIKTTHKLAHPSVKNKLVWDEESKQFLVDENYDEID